MFRKDRDLTERSRTLLKNKETKTLKAEVLKQFPSITEDEINALLPNKVNLTSIKLVDRTILYAVDDVVIFFDVKGRNNLYPSIVTLWKIPHIVKTMVTHGAVSRNLIRGADLMVPGVIQRDATLPGLMEKEKCAVKIYGNPLPFAIGDSCFDFSTILTARKGKALDILHCYGDLLVPAHSVVLPPGYFKEEILPTETITATQAEYEESDSDEKETNSADKIEIAEESEPIDGETAEKEVDSQEIDEKDTEKGKQKEELAMVEDDLQILTVNDTPENDEPEQQLTPQEYGNIIMHVFILFLKHVVKDPLLPMLVSTMWPMFQRVFTFLYPALHAPLATVLKKSIFSKPVVLLAHAQSIGVLTFDEKSAGVYVIRSIQRSHTLFREHKYEEDAERLREVASNVNNGDDIDDSGIIAEDETTLKPNNIGDKRIKISIKPTANAKGSNNKQNMNIEIVDLYKLPRKCQDIFRGYYQRESTEENEMAGGEEIYFGDHLLRTGQVRVMLQSYVRDRQFVRQEKVLSDSTNSKNKKQQMRAVLTVPETDPLFELFESTGQVTFVPENRISVESSNENNYEDSAHVNENNYENEAVDETPANPVGEVEELEPSNTQENEQDTEDKEDKDSIEEDEEDKELTEEERRALLEILQQPSSSESSGLFASIDKMYATSNNKHELKIAIGGLKQFSGDDDNYYNVDDQDMVKKKTNAQGNTIFSKPVYLSAAPKPKTVTKKASSSAVSSANNKRMPQNNTNSISKKAAKLAATQASVISCPAHMQRAVTLSWEESMKTLQSKLTAYHAILAPVSNHSQERDVLVRSGPVPTVKVLTEKRAGNKTVTVIRNLDTLLAVGNIDLETVTKAAQKKFACSCAVSHVPGILQQKEIVVQGPFAMDVPQFLLETQGVPIQYVEIVPSKHLTKKKR